MYKLLIIDRLYKNKNFSLKNRLINSKYMPQLYDRLGLLQTISPIEFTLKLGIKCKEQLLENFEKLKAGRLSRAEKVVRSCT